MSLFSKLLKKKEIKRTVDITEIRKRFDCFLQILEKNNDALKSISDLEEKSSGEYLFDMEFIKKNLDEIDGNIKAIAELLNVLSNNRYSKLNDAYSRIHDEIYNSLPGEGKIIEDDAIIPFEKLDASFARQVGSKCANLGELKNRVGLSVPNGFAISAYGYQLTMDNNQIQEIIHQRLDNLDLNSYDDLEQTSKEIQEKIKKSQLPDEIKQKIELSAQHLIKNENQEFFSVRSSALGEDTQFSFAGQYSSYLNVRKDQIVDCYREVMASQFSHRAMYYFLGQGLKENELAMSVGCMKMVNAQSAGVIYTVNPIDAHKHVLIINSVWGLGKLVVDGTITPDSFVVDKNSMRIINKDISNKQIQSLIQPDGGVASVAVLEEKQNKPSLSDDQILELAQSAIKIEKHYDEPQDIEWAIDDKGEIYFLQSRPLRTYKKVKEKMELDLSNTNVLFQGGVTAANGVGGGKVFHLQQEEDLKNCPDNAVIVSHTPFPSLVMIMNRVNAIITEVGGVTGHMATVAREFGIPTLMDIDDVFKKIPADIKITLDADNQTIYEGIVQELIKERSSDQNIFEDTALFVTLERILKKIVPLHLVSPKSSDFVPDNCRTYHDITRFAHQKALYEMFQVVEISKSNMAAAPKLLTTIPLPIRLLFIDSEFSHLNLEKEISDDNIPSAPMKAFWEGVRHVGWPHPPSLDMKGFASVLTTSISSGAAERSSFSENSFALLSKEYMNFSIRMGYHYSTIEALCSETPNKNYIRLKFQEGGASLDRRRRRVKLIINILKQIGFENSSKKDFLDSSISHCGKEEILKKLKWLGALSIHTKQLDMTLSNDEIAGWYEEDILKKLKELP